MEIQNDEIIDFQENNEDGMDIEILISNLPLTDDIIIRLLQALNRRKKEYIQHTTISTEKGMEKRTKEKYSQTETNDNNNDNVEEITNIKNKNNNNQKNIKFDCLKYNNNNDDIDIFMTKNKENKIIKNKNTEINQKYDDIQCVKKRKLEELIQKSRALNVTNVNNSFKLQESNEEKENIKTDMIGNPLHRSKKENNNGYTSDNINNQMEEIKDIFNFHIKNNMDVFQHDTKNQVLHDNENNANDEDYDYEKLQKQYPVRPQYINTDNENKT